MKTLFVLNEPPCGTFWLVLRSATEARKQRPASCRRVYAATSSGRCGSSAPSHRSLAPIRLVASPETGAAVEVEQGPHLVGMRPEIRRMGIARRPRSPPRSDPRI